MAIYKRGDVYWYEFRFNGQRIQESSQTSNKDAARQIEAAHRVRLAKGEAGIIERPPAPTLRGFRAAVRQGHRDLMRRQTGNGGLLPGEVPPIDGGQDTVWRAPGCH